jgi:hypothetical protein
MDKKWKFCLANGCWWVVIDNIEQFLEYKDKTSTKYGHAIVKGACGNENPYQQLYDAAEHVARNQGTSVVFGMASLMDRMFQTQYDAIANGHTLWFNDMGGYNYGLERQKIAYAYRDKLRFPNYMKKDIRISKWGDGGVHYYAKVGEIEVKEIVNGEVRMKWNTYDEAYQKALEYCSDGKEQYD